MRAVDKFRDWFGDLPYTDPIKKRLAPVLQGFYTALIAALLLAIVLAFILLGTSWLTPSNLVATALFILATVGGLRLLRRGYLNWALGLIIVTLMLNEARSLAASGFLQSQQTLLNTIFPLTLAAFLLGRRALIFTALVNFIIIAVIALQQHAALLAANPAANPQTVTRLVGFALTIALFSILLDLFTNVLRSALTASIQREGELEKEIVTRKQIEKTLAQQREQYRVTLASIGDAVIATDTTGQVMFSNEIAAELTGWPPDEAIGRPLHQVFPIMNEYTLEPVENPLTRVLSDGVVVGLANHTVLMRRDGTYVPIADSGAPIRDENGPVIGAVLVFRDVTEERRAENELRESEERFRVLADNAPVLIWLAGIDGRRYYFNKQWFLFTGRTGEQEAGFGWTEIIHPDDHDRFMEIYTAAFERREPFSLEYRLRRSDGEYRWIIVKGDPRFSAGGDFIGFIGTCMDIHERIEAEKRAELLQTLTAALSSALTVEEVARMVVEEGFSLLDVHLGVVALVDKGDKTIEIVGQHNVPDALLAPYQPLKIDEATPLNDAIRAHEAVWIENLDDYQRQYPQLAGRALAASTQTQSIASLPLIVNKRTIGGLSLSFRRPQRWDDERRAFMLALAGQCAQAMERAQLHHQSQLAAALEERQRLARELHDAVSQTLFSATIIGESLPNLMERNPERAAEQLGQIVTLNRAAMSEMRTLLLELRPEAILKNSLAALLGHLVDAAKGRKSLRAQLNVDAADDPLPSNVHIAFYRIAQETINNILKHSGATQISVDLDAQPDHVYLHIADNGRGFDRGAITAGLGLDNMRERAASIGAILDILSEVDKGTQVTVRWEGEKTADV